MSVKGRLADGSTTWQTCGTGRQGSIAQGWVEESISDNPATLAMFRKLIQPGYAEATVVATVKAISLPLTL